jgi:phosphate starvation-inducible protein PhoH
MAKKKTGQSFFTLNNLRLKEILPKTFNQHQFFDHYAAGKHILMTGCPGTGKSFLSIYKALVDVMSAKSSYKGLTILRSVVPSREMGYLPGTIEEKIKVYEEPYEAIFAELFERPDAYRLLTEAGIVEFTSTSFLRGTTFKNRVVIVDELQNMKFEELNTIITRSGDNCKMVFCGDFYQTDLCKKDDQSGFHKFKDILGAIQEFAFVTMGVEDIVRSLLVKKYIIARIEYEKTHAR